MERNITRQVKFAYLKVQYLHQQRNQRRQDEEKGRTAKKGQFCLAGRANAVHSFPFSGANTKEIKEEDTIFHKSDRISRSKYLNFLGRKQITLVQRIHKKSRFQNAQVCTALGNRSTVLAYRSLQWIKVNIQAWISLFVLKINMRLRKD